MLSEAYREGMQYANQYGSLYNNPYPRGTIQHNEFERGWSQEHKRNPGAIRRADRLREERESRTKKQKEKAKSLARELYRKAKDGG